MIDRPWGRTLVNCSESVTMERLQFARYSVVILESRSEWHSKKCSQRGDPTGTTDMNRLLLGRFCLLEPSGKVISDWPVKPAWVPSKLCSRATSQNFKHAFLIQKFLATFRT